MHLKDGEWEMRGKLDGRNACERDGSGCYENTIGEVGGVHK